MCGIVGCIGNEASNDIVLEGLRRLEYRGYDSCGISYVINNRDIKCVKSIDRIKDLKENVVDDSVISLGHTRWATHGGVNLENAHPHVSNDKKMSIVHNGVIENYIELKEMYCKNIVFKSETDTEVLLYVLKNFYESLGNMNDAICKFMNVVHGSYALIVYHIDFDNKLFAIKNKSPMLIGKGANFYTISSDPSAVIDKVESFYQIQDHRFLVIEQGQEALLYNKEGNLEKLKFEVIDMEYEEISTKNYDSFMHKEIEEQPNALRNIANNYKTLGFDKKLIQTITEASKFYIVACGTSYHAGLVASRFIKKELNKPVEVVIASEYGYDFNIIEEGAAFIFISQSGETADSMVVFNKVLKKYPTIAITNVRGSQMDRNADFSLQLFAGVEIAVASTKAYTAQIAVLASLIYYAVGKNEIFEEILKIADYQDKVIENQNKFKDVAKKLSKYREVFYLGRLSDYYLAQECALKIKEITYINVNAMASGELKHGTISLVDENKMIFSIITDPEISANSRSNIEEVKARGGDVITFSTSNTSANGDDYILEYDSNPLLAPLVAVIPHQYISLFTAIEMKLDVDKPRNLAKAVTVE